MLSNISNIASKRRNDYVRLDDVTEISDDRKFIDLDLINWKCIQILEIARHQTICHFAHSFLISFAHSLAVFNRYSNHSDF